MATYTVPEIKAPAAVAKGEVLMIASGDLRQSANQVCWPAQAEVERAVTKAFAAEGWTVRRAHPYREDLKHGFIYNQRMGMDVFEGIDPQAPIVVVEAVWQYTHHILSGLVNHRGPILTVANWSGQWPGLVGMLNLNGSLLKAGVKFSTIWSKDFDDPFFVNGLKQWIREGRIDHDTSQVHGFDAAKLPAAERELGVALAKAELGGEGGFNAEGEVVEALGVAVEERGDAGLGAGDGQVGEALAGLQELEADGAGKTVELGGQVLGDFVLGFGDELGGGGWGGGAEVGGEVGDGEVGFMADGGDDGKARGGDGAGDALGVEGGQVFKRAAAAGEDDDVDEGWGVGAGGVEAGEGGFDFGGGLVALDGDGDDEDAEAGVAAGDDGEEVADDSAGGRGDDADGAGKGRQGTLAGGVEEAFGFETLLELLEGELERAGADGLHGFGHKLHLAALLVDAYAAANQDVDAVLGSEAEEHGLAAKEDDGELGVSVLEGEVDVAGGGGTVVGDFAFDPDVAVLLLDELTDLGDQFRGPARCGGWSGARRR